MQGILKWGLWLVSFIALLGAGAILASPQPVRSLCRTSCWFNDLLFVLFGEGGGKLGLAMGWLGAAILLAVLAYRMRSKPS